MVERLIVNSCLSALIVKRISRFVIKYHLGSTAKGDDMFEANREKPTKIAWTVSLIVLMSLVAAIGCMRGSVNKAYAELEPPAWSGSFVTSSGTQVSWSIIDYCLTISAGGDGDIGDYSDEPSGVTSAEWGEYADYINKIVIKNGVWRLGQRAFSGLSNVSEIDLGKTVERFGDGTFRNCTSLKELNIPASLEWWSLSYGPGIYDCDAGCTSLESINVASGNKTYRSIDGVLYETAELGLVKYPPAKRDRIYVTPSNLMGTQGFSGNKYLETLIIPSLKDSDYARFAWTTFSSCTSIKNIIFTGNPPTDMPCNFSSSKVTMYYPAGNSAWTPSAMEPQYDWGWGTADVTWQPMKAAGSFGDDLAWIVDTNGRLIITGSGSVPANAADSTWSPYADDITSIIVEEGVTGIGSSALRCWGAEEISLPSTLTDLASNAFEGCYSVRKVDVAKGNPAFALKSGALFAKDLKTLVYCPAHIDADIFVIPEGTQQIGAFAFQDCTWLEGISIPDSVSYLGNAAFMGCTRLASLIVPNKVTEIPASCFSYCENLSSLRLPAGITLIGDSAFYGCVSMTSFAVPASVAQIDEFAFANCTNLTDFYFGDMCPMLGNSIFRGVEANAYYDADDELGCVYYYGGQYDGAINWIPKVDLSTDPNAITLVKSSLVYTGKALKPGVKYYSSLVSGIAGAYGLGGVVSTDAGSMLSVAYANNVNVGQGTVTIKGCCAFKGTVTKAFTITKAANSLSVGAKSASIKYSKLKKKAKSLTVSKLVRFIKKGQGAMSYVKVSGNKKIKINKTTGKVTVKKGLKKGTYKVKVKVKAAGDKNYKPVIKTVTFRVKVK